MTTTWDGVPVELGDWQVGRLPGWHAARPVKVYAVAGATQRDLEDAMIVAYENRWDPPEPQ